MKMKIPLKEESSVGVSKKLRVGLMRLVNLLENNEEFRKNIVDIRKRHGIPPEGWSDYQRLSDRFIKPLLEIVKSKGKIDYKDLIQTVIPIGASYELLCKDVIQIMDKFGIPAGLFGNIRDLVCLGYIITEQLNREITLSAPDNDKFFYPGIYSTPPEGIHITLSAKVSQEDLFEWLGKNWELIKRLMISYRLPKYRKTSPNLEEFNRIIYLLSQDKSYNDIADIFYDEKEKELKEKFGEPLSAKHQRELNKINEDSIKKKVSRIKKYIQNPTIR